MANNLLSPAPLKFIAYPDQGKKTFTITQEARDFLEKIKKPIRVIGIVGGYRGGKSYIMNRLLNAPNGFDLGHTTVGKTRGIWMWGRDEGASVLLCVDTEGLFDPANRSPQLDAKIFAISIMIVSILIYNVMMKLDETQISQLHLITELLKHVHTSKDNVKKGNDAMLHLPPLLWLIRDFSLQLDPSTPTPKAYLDDALKQVDGNDDESDRANSVRTKLKKIIPDLTCETLPFPTKSTNMLASIETDPSVLSPEFATKCDKLIAKLLAETKLKSIRGDDSIIDRLDGPAYLCFVEKLVTAISNEKAFVIPDAFDAIATQQTLKAITEAASKYEAAMKPLESKFPMDSGELEGVHSKALSDSISHITQNAIGDKQKIIQEFRERIEVRKGDELQGGIYFGIFTKNKTASETQCTQIWENLVHPIQDKIGKGSYKDVDEFQNDVQKAKDTYNKTAKGPAKEQYRKQFEAALEKDYNNLMNKLQLDEIQKQQIIERKKADETARALEETKRENQRLAEESQERFKQFELQQRKMEEQRSQEKQAWEERLQRERKEMDEKLELAKKQNDETLQAQLASQKAALEKQFQEDAKKRDEKWEKERAACDNEKQSKFGLYYNPANGDYIFVDHNTGQKAVFNGRRNFGW